MKEGRGETGTPRGTRIMDDTHLWQEEKEQRERHRKRYEGAAEASKGDKKHGSYVYEPEQRTVEKAGSRSGDKNDKTQGGGRAARATEPPENKNKNARKSTRRCASFTCIDCRD